MTTKQEQAAGEIMNAISQTVANKVAGGKSFDQALQESLAAYLEWLDEIANGEAARAQGVRQAIASRVISQLAEQT